MLNAFLAAVKNKDPSLIASASESFASHFAVFNAEKSRRRGGQVVRMDVVPGAWDQEHWAAMVDAETRVVP